MGSDDETSVFVQMQLPSRTDVFAIPGPTLPRPTLHAFTPSGIVGFTLEYLQVSTLGDDLNDPRHLGGGTGFTDEQHGRRLEKNAMSVNGCTVL
jgi:hypothetical protein